MLLLVRQGLRFPGFRPSVLSDGSWGPGVKNFGTPKAWLASESFTRKPVMRLNSSISLDYTPIEGLKISAIGAYNFTNEQQKDFKATLPVNIDGVINTLGPSKLTEKNTNTEYKSFQATVNYAKSFNDVHNMDILVGYSWEDETARDLEANRQNFPNNNYPYLTVGSPDVQTNAGGGEDWVIQSIFGRAQYNYAERYLAEVTMRYDGSSRFPKDSRYAFFPSAALGWRLSEESFIKENENLSFINNLKLKASIGMLGNNNIGNYAYQSVYVLGDSYNYPLGGIIQQGASLVNYTDPNLKWETTRTFDVGVESVLWNGLLSANITYFNRYTYDILFKPNASASAIFGLTMNEVNTGEALNQGWEFEVGHSNSVGEFSYSINANFSIINNGAIAVDGTTDLALSLTNNGSITIPEGAQLFVAGNNVTLTNDATALNEYGTISNAGNLGIRKNATSGVINNYGYIKQENEDAYTYVTNNATASANFANAFSASNKIGTIELNGKGNVNTTVADTNRQGFIKVTTTAATVSDTEVGTVANYVVITGDCTNYKATADNVKYVDVQSSKRVVFNVGNSTDAYELTGLVVNEGYSINIPVDKNVEVTTTYLKGYIYYAGEFTSTNFGGYLGTADNNNVIYQGQ